MDSQVLQPGRESIGGKRARIRMKEQEEAVRATRKQPSSSNPDPEP